MNSGEANTRIRPRASYLSVAGGSVYGFFFLYNHGLCLLFADSMASAQSIGAFTALYSASEAPQWKLELQL
jgi:hypothetical protein